MLFSQRQGLKPIKQVIQLEDIDNDLKNGLWNALTIFYWERVNQPFLVIVDRIHGERSHYMLPFLRVIWHSYF
ncbi:Hypothetical protein LUCI_4623 [Lucifera butyrica]|uniref:HEPN AbiJ-N-terminal domain-containing protein n=1 Tax=Lucifera butyrica TaxID=1351585 RepID=A0A498RGV0_9FIRM|nr:Hypothetical protein LUCI_4623 [Lucifera butyrica]